MSTETVSRPQTASYEPTLREPKAPDRQGQWWRFLVALVVTAVVIVPIVAVLYLSLRPGLASKATGWTLENFAFVATKTQVLTWLRNSLGVTVVTASISVAVAAFAGYVLSRGRSALVSGFSLILFIVQSLPFVTAVIPLFVLFAQLGLVDNLGGVTIIYIG
ncbi:MAG: hypothetical protein WAM30_00990, partial [Candidatus Dormiibacterota bacterium]